MAGENDNIRIKQIKVSNNESHEIAARSLLTAGGNERTFEDILRGGFYGICSTLPSVQNKVVVTNLSLHSAISLRAGSVIRVKFTYPNTYYDPENASESLRNINLVLKDADEETVLATDPVVAYLENGVSWRAGEIVEFVYDGADWNPVQIRDEGIEPYQPIEYAIFNGSHYVDSDLRFKNTTNYSITFTIRETTPAYGLVGSYETDYDYVVKNSNATNLSWYYNTQTQVTYTQANWATNTLYTIKVNGNNLFLNNNLVLTAVKKNFTDTLTAYFGNRNSANTWNGLDGRLYGFTIDHEGVHYNYVPCYRKSDNVLGFYDAGTKAFLPVHIYGSENLVTYTKNTTGGDIVKNADLLVNQTDLQNALFTVSKDVDLQDVTNNGNITTNDIITKGDLIVQGSESDSTSSSQIQFRNTSTGAKTGYFTSNTANQFIIGLGDTSYYNFNTTNLRPVTNKAGVLDLGATGNDWRNIYLNGSFYKRNGNNTYTLTVPNKTGTIALLSDIPGAAPNEYGKISDGTTTTTADAQQDTITFAKSGDLTVDVTGDTVTYGYSHPTTTAVSASYYEVGKDALGHVVLGNAFVLPTKASWDYDDRYVRFDTNAQGLTDTQKANARTNIGAGTGNGTVTSVDSINPTAGNVALSAVRYVSQTLTDAQKIQARINIGAGTGTVQKVNNVAPDNNGNVSLTIPATNVIPAVSTANKVLLSTATSGTAKWSDFNTAGFLKTNNSGVISIDSTEYQSKLTTQTAYTAVGSSTKVPVITTNTLGQVTAISTADIVSANNATLTVQRNSNTVGTFTANASVDKTINIKDIYTVSLSDIDSTHSTAETYVFTADFSAIVESMQYTLAIDLALFNPSVSGMVYVKPEFGGITLDSSVVYTYACAPGVIAPRTPIPMLFYKENASDTQLSLSVAQAGAAVSGAASLESVSYSNNDFSAYNGDYTSVIFTAKTLNDNSILDSGGGTLEDCLIARPLTMPTATADSADFVANDGKLYTKKIEESGSTTTYSYEEVGASVELPQVLRYI